MFALRIPPSLTYDVFRCRSASPSTASTGHTVSLSKGLMLRWAIEKASALASSPPLPQSWICKRCRYRRHRKCWGVRTEALTIQLLAHRVDASLPRLPLEQPMIQLFLQVDHI